MSKQYNHKKIEKRWQKEWAKKKIYKTEERDRKFYILDMFPYPSGEGLHVGHPKGYIATDIISRFHRMKGYDVLHPMGFDAFGLPAENYAIKNKIHPEKAVKKNIKHYKKQLEEIGFDYDWDREIDTTDPKYYKWTQWIFLKMFEKGLAYESYEPINWCPVDKTGLANEDVEDGRCERCGTLVEKKPMRQWVLKITEYADRLLAGLDKLNWPESIKESQKHWIGRSEGAEIDFNLVFKKNPSDNARRDKSGKPAHIKVFTTRPDTLFGVTYIVLSPEHLWVTLATDEKHNVLLNKAEVLSYVNEVKNKTDIDRTAEGKEKTGVELKGVMAVNPANGEEIPIWVADYVLADYGTGAVMAVPAHDVRDAAFAVKYNLPIKEVVLPNIVDKRNPPIEGKKIVERKNIHAIVKDPRTGKYLALKWKKFDWTTFPMGGVEDGEDVVAAARREVKEETGFVNLELVKVLDGQVRAEYFAAHKDQNRVSFTTAVVFNLVDHALEEIDEKEKDAHDTVWLSESQLNYENMTHAEIEMWNEKMVGASPAYTGEGVLIGSGSFSGFTSENAKRKITEYVHGAWVVKYKLRDWVFSRQRYWGEPIPLIHCEHCGVVAVPEKDLPVELPKVKYYEPTGTGESPLAAISKWVNVKCPKCAGKASRETNTMPQWAGSSWYYLRYMDPLNSKQLVNGEKEKYWSPVDWYVGGAEHATRHLIYARFWHKFLFDIGVVSTEEPFKKLQSVGLIMAEDGRKMSKRWKNVVNPTDVIEQYGADTLRVYEMFMGPFDQAISWSTKNMIGSRRFLERVWRLREKLEVKSGKLKVERGRETELKLTTNNQKLETLLHQTIKKVGEDITAMRFNTAISQMMILVNELEKEEIVDTVHYQTVLKMLAPFAPHISEELWRDTGNKTSIHLEQWPIFTESKIVEKNVNIVVQINGKVRTAFECSIGATEDAVRKIALELPETQKWLSGQTIKKVIYVQNKIINFVL